MPVAVRVNGRRGIAAALLLPLLAGCASFADKREYADYRAYRLQPDERPRLLAAMHYVQDHPDGRWVDVVQEEREARERDVYQEVSALSDPLAAEEGLRFYIEAYPEGRYKDIAEERLAAVVAVIERQRAMREAAVERTREEEQERQERIRTWVTRATRFWTTTLVNLSNWGSSIAKVARENQSFSRAFGQSPQPRCSREECVKFYETSYSIPVPGGTRLDRKMVLTLRLRFVEGKLRRTEILYPNKGFSRWYEHESRELVIDEDPQSRETAVDWALARIVPVLEELAPNAATLEDASLDIIDAITVDQPEEAEAIAGVTDQPPPEEAPVEETPAPEAETPERDMDAYCDENPEDVECLMRRAAGDGPIPGESTEPEPQPEPEPEPVVEEPKFYPPTVLRAFDAGDLEMMVFIAPLEASGDQAYDGIVISHAPESEAGSE